MFPCRATIPAPHCSIFLRPCKIRSCQNKRSLILFCPLKHAFISGLSVVIAIGIMDFPMLYFKLALTHEVQIRFRHGFLIRIKASWFVHVIPDVNIRISPNIIFLVYDLVWNFMIKLWKCLPSFGIHEINPNWLAWPALSLIRFTSLSLNVKFIVHDFFI